MVDIEKVIEGLEHCRLMTSNITFNPCYECPYKGDYSCADILKTDALEMLKEQETPILTIDDAVSELMDRHYDRLKEQEAVKPEWYDGTPFCGNCGHRLEKKNRNMEIKCPTCGRSVKWE